MRIQREHDKHLTTEIGAGVLYDVTADEFLVSASVYGIGRDGKPIKFLISLTERELDQLMHARDAFDDDHRVYRSPSRI